VVCAQWSVKWGTRMRASRRGKLPRAKTANDTGRDPRAGSDDPGAKSGKGGEMDSAARSPYQPHLWVDCAAHRPSRAIPAQGAPRRDPSLPGGRAARGPLRLPRCLPRPCSRWARSRSPRSRSCVPPDGRPASRPAGPSAASTCLRDRGPRGAGTSGPGFPQPSRGAAPTAQAVASRTSSCPAPHLGCSHWGAKTREPNLGPPRGWPRPPAVPAPAGSGSYQETPQPLPRHPPAATVYPILSLKSGLRGQEGKELPGRGGEKGTQPGRRKEGKKGIDVQTGRDLGKELESDGIEKHPSRDHGREETAGKIWGAEERKGKHPHPPDGNCAVCIPGKLLTFDFPHWSS
jgi:hypothetical protein